MPFLTDEELGGGFLPRASTQAPKPEAGGSALATAGKIAAPVAVGAGLVFAPLLTLGGIAVAGAGSYAADPEGTATNFRVNNPAGSYLASESFGFSGKDDPDYDPWADIAGTPYEPHWDKFTAARSADHGLAIKADIDRETKDRAYLEGQGPIGIAEGLAAGMLDPTNLLPFGGAVRSARGGYSALKSAGSVAAYSAGGAAASETMLHATQQLRTGEETAYAIGGATILGGVLGASIAGKMTRAELDSLGAKVQADLARGSDDAAPAMAERQPPDNLSPEGAAELAPQTSQILDAHSQDTDALTSELKAVASRILPNSVRLNVAESLDAAGAKAKDDVLYGIRAYHGTPHDFDTFSLDKVGTGEGEQVFGHGLYFAEHEDVAASYKNKLGAKDIYLDGKPFLVGDKQVGSTGSKTIDSALIINNGNVTPAIHSALGLARLLEDSKPERAAELRRDAEELMAFKAGIEIRQSGVLYEVEIDAEPGKLLDYDSKLADQPEMLAKAEKLLAEIGAEVSPLLRTQPGSWLHSELEAHLGSPEAASKALRDAGIPGIRYLDQGSRDYSDDPSATRNIVLFDDSLVKITAKNGQPVTAAERKAAIDEMMGIRKDAGGTTVEGKYDPARNLITISRAALDPVSTLHHEAVHALKNLGLFTPREWKALENAAGAKGWLTAPEIAEYAKLYDAARGDPRLTEEAIAMAYQRFIAGTEPQKGVIGSAFGRMRKFLDAVKSALTGKGFHTADDIFARIDAGEVAARARSAEDGARAKASRPGSVGAAAKGVTDDRLKGALGLERAMARLSPGLWLQNSPSRAARSAISELGETGTYRRDMADWTPAAHEGAEMGQYGAVESRVKVFQGRDLAEGFQAIDDAFMKYRSGQAKRRTGDLTVTSLSDAMLGSGNKLDFRQFREAVGEAMASGDTHQIAEVAGLAKTLRPIFDRWKDEAIKTGLLPEGVSVETAPSYMMRLYNRKRIISERDQFKSVITQWLGEVEKANARVRDSLKSIMDELGTAEADALRTEEGIAKRAEKEKTAAKNAKAKGVERPDRSEEIAARDEEDKAFIAERQARAKELEKLIEEQVEAYQGKTASAAKSALEARRQADAARDPAAARREQRILKPVREAAEAIAAQEPKTAAELPGLADEIIDRILSTPEGRLPYDAASNKVKHAGVDMDARGPLAARVFQIPDKMIAQWLERDIDTLLRAYLHTMVPDIELAKRFGTPDMMLEVKKITEDYAKLSAEAKSPGERLKLHRQRDEDIRNLAAIRDRLRGTYKVPEDPEAIMLRTARTALTLSYLSKLGGMTVSAITDPARFFAVHGTGAFADGFIPLFRNAANFRVAGREATRLAGAFELINDSRALRMADISDTWGANTKFERVVQSGGRNFGMVSLMAPWNATMKQTASVMSQNRILRNAVKVANGSKLSRKETEFMAFLGLSEGVTRKIGEQFKAKGVKKSGLYFANAADWSPDARNAKDAMSAALRKIVDFTIITPGQSELPKFASTIWGKLLLQFKSFAISATNKMLISGLQQRDAAAASGALLSIALGGLVYILKMEAAGKPAIVPKSFDDPNWKIFMAEAFDRSGLGGILSEGNNILEKVSRGKLGLSALTGKPISRYASRNVMQSVAGPVIGMAEDAAAVAGSVFDDREWTQKDTHRIRQMLPYQNLFYLRSAFDQVEKGINEKFGVRERAAR